MAVHDRGSHHRETVNAAATSRFTGVHHLAAGTNDRLHHQLSAYFVADAFIRHTLAVNVCDT